MLKNTLDKYNELCISWVTVLEVLRQENRAERETLDSKGISINMKKETVAADQNSSWARIDSWWWLGKSRVPVFQWMVPPQCAQKRS